MLPVSQRKILRLVPSYQIYMCLFFPSSDLSQFNIFWVLYRLLNANFFVLISQISFNLIGSDIPLKSMQKGDDPGKFRQLDEIVFISGYPGYQHLLSIAVNSMQVLCDAKGGLPHALFYYFSKCKSQLEACQNTLLKMFFSCIFFGGVWGVMC